MTDAESACDQMRLVYNQFARDRFDSPPPLEGKGSVKVLHYIQSFSPDDNVTPELAHKIAMTMVRKNFGDDVQAVIATHIDKDHLHSHIIINSYSLSGRKFYANKESLRQFRRNSDGVCKAFGIDIHPNLKGEGRLVDHYEWEQKKNGTSWKEQIRNEINRTIPTVTSLDELLQTLEECGYEIKRGKYISVKAPGQERFVRTKTLGEEYTEESLNIRITYRDIGSGITPPKDEQSKLSRAYAAVLHDVRVLAEQHKKVQRKRNVTAEYSVDNDLDVYRLSAQQSVINKEHISSIGELEGRISRLKEEYEKRRGEINDLIDEHNRHVSLWEQAQEFYSLSQKGELSDTEQLRRTVCKQAMERNNVFNAADADSLRRRTESLAKRIGSIKNDIEKCRQKYEVYSDIRDAYYKISKVDYLRNLVEEERKHREQVKKKTKSR